MSQNKSPDGSYPDFPFVLPIDGESITEDKLCVSATTGLGWIGKLIDAVGYLKARSPQVFNVRSDGAGGASFQRKTPGDDGVTDFFSSVTASTGYLTLTYTTALADADDAAIVLSINGAVDWVPQVHSKTTTYVRIRAYDISAAGAADLTTIIGDFDVVVYPNLAGMT